LRQAMKFKPTVSMNLFATEIERFGAIYTLNPICSRKHLIRHWFGALLTIN
jgi:hypothetical protein